MRDKIKKLIEEESAIDFSYGINSYTIYDHNIDKLVDSIVKLLDLHIVSNNKVAVCDCDYPHHQTDRNGREYCRKCGKDWNEQTDC